MGYLRDIEWSMGNGQCPSCHGVPPEWHGHPLHMEASSIGHELDCALAKELAGAGEKPLMIGDFKSDVVYERCITKEGFLSTRPKALL